MHFSKEIIKPDPEEATVPFVHGELPLIVVRDGIEAVSLDAVAIESKV